MWLVVEGITDTPMKKIFALFALLIPLTGLAAPSEFLRIDRGDDGIGAFQTAVVSYRNGEGVQVDLVSVVHIAEADYYRALNEKFTEYEAILYELVAPADTKPEAGEPSGHPISAIQRQMKDTLDLSFQLDEVDYSPKNFYHADLDPAGLSEAMDERGENAFTLVLKMMSAQYSSGGPVLNNATMMGAMLSNDPNNSLKYLFAKEMLQQISGAFSQLSDEEKGLALLVDRNKAAVKRLQELMAEEHFRRYAIFYGAAHMAGLESLLLDMGFQAVGQPDWFSAWTFYGLALPQQ